MKNKRKLVIAMADHMGIELFESAFTDCKDMFTKPNSAIGDYDENIYDPINNLEQMWDVADKFRITTGNNTPCTEFYAYSELIENDWNEIAWHEDRKTVVLMSISDLLGIEPINP